METTLIKLMNNVELYPGDMLQVKDKERKEYTLKYEGTNGKNTIFRQMGRNTSKIIEVETATVADFIHTQYRKSEKVMKF